MKNKILLIVLVMFMAAACGNDSESVQPQQEVVVQDSLPTLKGEFIFLSDAAVFKGSNFVYGVAIDSISKDLAEQVEAYKQDQFDMIPVTVKGKILPNSSNKGWDEFIEIREVLSISVPQEEPADSATN